MNNQQNPLSDLINDETYHLLNERGLINQTSVRDYIIRKKFKRMREQQRSAGEAIDLLREEYPYLQYDSIRKIVYQGGRK
jgi:hypothetical protein